jgi:hypothetical protein
MATKEELTPFGEIIKSLKAVDKLMDKAHKIMKPCESVESNDERVLEHKDLTDMLCRLQNKASQLEGI